MNKFFEHSFAYFSLYTKVRDGPWLLQDEHYGYQYDVQVVN